MANKAKDEDRKANPYNPDPLCDHVSPGWKRIRDKEGDMAATRCSCWLRWKGLDVVSEDRKTVAAGER